MPDHLSLSARDAAALDEFVRQVRETLGTNLVALKLFGSKARRHDAPESDIDVLVVVDDASVEIEDRVLDVAIDVGLAHEVYVSPRVIACAVLDDPVWKITPFLRAVEKEGVPL